MPKQYSRLVLLCMLGMVWGSGYAIARYCTTHGVPPLGYSFWQSFGPALVLNGLLLAKRQRLIIESSAIRYYLLCGLIGISIPNAVMYFAASHLSSALLTILVNTVPLIIYPFSILTRQEHFAWPRMLILGVGIFGIFLIILNQQGVPTLANIPWTIVVLASPVCFAACAVFVNPLKPSKMEALNAAAGMLLASAILLTPVIIKTDMFYQMTWNLPSAMILLEIILSSLGYILFFRLLETAGPVYYSLVAGVVSLTGLFWGKMLFKENLTLVDYLGTACILFGILTLTAKPVHANSDSVSALKSMDK